MIARRLREAARVLRERAEATECHCGGPACPHNWYRLAELLDRFDNEHDDALFVVTMSPPVALAVADWLDEAASGADRGFSQPSGSAVADAILRTT